MKLQKLLLIALLGLSLVPRVPAQALSDEAEKKAREMLRDYMQQRDRPLGPKPAPAPAYTTPVIPVPVHATQPAAVSLPATNLVPTGLRNTSRTLSYQEMEQQYLAGKITARQFQKYLKDRTLEPASRSRLVPSGIEGQAVDILRQASAKTNLNAALLTSGSQPVTANTAPVSPTPPMVVPDKVEGPPEQTTLKELESKMDELLRLKAERDQLALKNATTVAHTNTVAAPPRTKRERLDDLLKLYVNGKLSDSEYKAAREKVLAEPAEKD